MNELHNKLGRRTLITLIIVLALVQVGILGYLWSLLQPPAMQETAESAPLFQWPSGDGFAASTPGGDRPTPTPDEVEIVVASSVRATDHSAFARAFDEERALEHLAYLASDELGGRQPGAPGGWTAGNYIAARFAAYGLEPAGLNSTYFQTFTVPYGQITSLPVLTIVSPRGETLTHTYAYRTAYRALTGGYLGAGEGEGVLVWLNECLHDAYAGFDMTGKIALCRYTGDPEVYRQAIEHQVGGLLLLDRERDGKPFRRGGYRETAWAPQTIPAYLISETVARDLILGSDYTLDDLSLRFAATPLSTTVRMAVTLEEQEEVAARNVLALLPGSDPEHSDEIVVIGAHYDHLGREPDGAIINGANDNGSGVATMLEIARLWQAAGDDLRPARSILFAAWDGEEQGLLGSRYYVEHPTLSLTRTVAMLNLDMVGAGETLQIDGEGDVAVQLWASAETCGITSTLTFMGRSDHFSFYEAGIPAAMYIWWPDAVYHTVDDKIQAIEPEKLKTVGVLSAHTLTALTNGRVELERAVERMRASIAAGDRDLFLEGLNPADPDLRAAQSAWFDSLWSRELTGVTIEPGRMRVGDGEADVSLRSTYRWAGATRRESSASYDARFVQRDGAWAFAGYELDELSGDVVAVARFPDAPVETRQLLSTTQRAYLSLAADLELEPITGTRFIFYPDAATMRAIARPASPHLPSQSWGGPRGGGWLVPSARLAEIAWGQPITPVLVNLALNQMGLPPDDGAWLREGLALHYESGAEREYLPALVAADVLTPLLDFSILSDLPDREAQMLRALCAAWGRRGGGTPSLQEALGLSPDQFESAWRAARLDPLRADAEGIRAAIAARVAAVLEGDAAGFLATVAPSDPVLRAEERNWFADLADHPASAYSVTWELTDWSPGGDEAIVALNVVSVITGGQPSRVSYDAHFVRDALGAGRWLYAGVVWSERASDHFVLKYQNRDDHDEAWAQRVLELAEAAYDQVVADLGAVPPLPQEIKVYDDPELFRTSVFLSLPDWASGWAEPGEAIKFWLRDESEHFIQRVIAHELTHQVLFAQGLEIAWLHEGVANFEAGRVLPLGAHWMAGRYLPAVQEAIIRHDEFPLSAFPSWDALEAVSDERAELFYAQSWSLVSFIVEQHGLPGLRQFIARSIASGDIKQATYPDTFLAEWQEYVRVAGLPDGLMSLAQRFDAERALEHIAVLASPEFGGREAGAPGADLAASYIAEQFADLGLEPLGDPLSPTVAVTGTAVVTGGLDYLQRFPVVAAMRAPTGLGPISYTHPISVPTLTLLDDGGAVLYEFVYCEEFAESAGEGAVEGELVWVHTDDLEGLSFGGTVILGRDVDAAQLQAHGAGELIVVTDKEPRHLQTEQVRRAGGYGPEIAIPVFEITEAAFETVLERLGIQRQELMFAPPALPLGVRARQTLARSPITTTFTANVLGLLPGSDPGLADEVLLVGAHYDHIGQLPGGLYFPGANQNASGVAALLEMARVWQATGYQPARSVLFVAWGGEELESAGVEYYLARPVVPLTRTVGVIALDSIAGSSGYKLLFFGEQDHDLPLIQPLKAGVAQLSRRAWYRGSAGEGWHTLFNSENIPTTKLIWAEAEKDFYLLTDTADAIDPERLANSGEILILTTSWLASQ